MIKSTMIESIVIILFIMSLVIYVLKYKSNVIPIEAFNNQAYLVNDLPDSQDAANTLARIMMTLNKLVNLIISHYKLGYNLTNDDHKFIKYIETIKKRLPDVKISENPTNSKFTSYSINKGEELVFCIRNKINKKIHNINELLYVAIHEIAHIGRPEIGHTELFRRINVYLLSKAVCYGLYKYIDYSYVNMDYCGMTLNSTILGSNYKCNKKLIK